MPVESGSLLNLPPIYLNSLWIVFEVIATILAIMYFIFSLIVIRQVSLMTESLITEVSPLMRGLSIIHSGVALIVVVYFVWVFYQL